MRMPVVMIQVRVEVHVIMATSFLHLEAHTRYSDADVAEPRGCRATANANEFLRT